MIQKGRMNDTERRSDRERRDKKERRRDDGKDFCMRIEYRSGKRRRSGGDRRDSNQKMSEIELCSQFLDEEISLIQPEVIVPLGYYSAQKILQKYHIDLLEPQGINTKIEFGKLLILKGQKIYPLYHPASLLYNPSYEAETVEKYKQLNG